MEFTFKHRILLRVRYGETDQMGYCYYGNYAQYFEVGRVEALRALGMSYKTMEQKGVMLPVSKYEVDYKYPAYYDDELTIETKITKLTGARLFFDYSIKNESDKLIAEATTTLVFVNKNTKKPCTPPQDFLKIIQKYAK
jgi:conserved hypothetical protein TIGR00051